MVQSDDFIWVVASTADRTQTKEPAERGIRIVAEEVVERSIKISAENLKSNLKNFFKNVTSLVSEIPERELPYILEEIEICAEISGEGRVQLIGGLSAGAKGGITFKLKRRKSN